LVWNTSPDPLSEKTDTPTREYPGAQLTVTFVTFASFIAPEALPTVQFCVGAEGCVFTLTS
jgi:hypothetical protein